MLKYLSNKNFDTFVRSFANYECKVVMEIKILGAGCSKCKHLEKRTIDAVNELGVEARVEKVEHIVQIMKYGVMSTPALIINEKVVMSGSLPSVKKIKELINKAIN